MRGKVLWSTLLYARAWLAALQAGGLGFRDETVLVL